MPNGGPYKRAVYKRAMAMIERSAKEIRELASRSGDGVDPDSLHRLRVASRRSLAAIQVLPGQVRRAPDVKAYSSSLKGILRETSGLRDTDTLLQTVRLFAGPPSPEMAAMVSRTRDEQEVGCLEALSRCSDLRAPPFDPSQTGSGKAVSRLAEKLERRARSVKKLAKKVAGSEGKVDDLHSLRVEVKKLKYLEEIASKDSKLQTYLGKMQDILGTIHDLDVASTYLLSKGRGRRWNKEIATLSRARHRQYRRFVKKFIPVRV